MLSCGMCLCFVHACSCPSVSIVLMWASINSVYVSVYERGEVQGRGGGSREEKEKLEC